MFGGNDWGQCQDNKNEEGVQSIWQKFTAFTSHNANASTDAPISLSLIGDEGQSDFFLIAENGFSKGAVFKTDVKTQAVGGLEEMQVKIEGEDKMWLCNKIEVQQEQRKWQFHCPDVIRGDEPEGTTTIIASGFSAQHIQVVSSSKTEGIIRAAMQGDMGFTPFFVLSYDGFNEGTFKIPLKNTEIGKLTRMKLVKTAIIKGAVTAPFSFESISVKHFKDNTVLSGAGKILNDQVTLRVGGDKKAKGFDEGSVPEPPSEMPQDIPDVREIDMDKADMMFPGGCLNKKEETKVIELGCEDHLGKEEIANAMGLGALEAYEELKLPTQSQILVKCAITCSQDGPYAIGLAIHPFDAPICAAGRADRSLPVAGGIMQVVVAAGLPKQEAPPNKKVVNGHTVESFAKSKLSYLTVRVDSVDMSATNVRVIDDMGNNSTNGRLEVRHQGDWKTVCAKYDSPSAEEVEKFNAVASFACQQLMQTTGSFWSPGSNCGGQCGAPSMKTLSIDCTDQGDLGACAQVTDASGCTHKRDMVIKCLDIDPKQPEPVWEFKTWLDGKNTKNQGVPQTWHKNKKSYFCKSGFTNREANAFCTMQGYSDGGALNEDEKQKFKPDNKKFVEKKATMIKKLECTSAAKTINDKDCVQTFDPLGCTSDDAVVVQCKGDLKPNEPPAPPLKKLQRLPLPRMRKLKCDTTLDTLVEMPPIESEEKTDEEPPPRKQSVFAGDPGSTQLLYCPPACKESGAMITGVGIYSSDSSICKAALHMGVIFDELGGIVQLSPSYPREKVHPSEANDITSMENNGPLVRTFSVTRPNSCSAYMSAINDTAGVIAKKDPKVMPEDEQPIENAATFLEVSERSRSFLRPVMLSFAETEEDDGGAPIPRCTTNPKAVEKLVDQFGQVPVFMWMPRVSTMPEFNGAKEVNTNGMPNFEATKNVTKTYTFLFGFRVTACPSDDKKFGQIFAHSGQGGYGLRLVGKGEKTNCMIEFVKLGTSDVFKTGQSPPEDAIGFSNQAIRFNSQTPSGTPFCEFWSPSNPSEKTSFSALELEFPDLQGDLVFGGNQGADFFEGFISHFEFFDSWVDDEQLKSMLQKGLKNIPGKGTATGVFTTDNRPCIAPCDTKPRDQAPPQPATKEDEAAIEAYINPDLAGEKAVEQELKEEDESGGGGGGGSGSSSGGGGGGGGKGKAEEGTDAGSPEATCSMTLKSDKFVNLKTGEKMRIECPSVCKDMTEAAVYGPAPADEKLQLEEAQDDKTSICRAAIHQGRINQDGGDVFAIIESGRETQLGSVRNGVESKNTGASTRAFRIEPAPPLPDLKCTDNLQTQPDRFAQPIGTKQAIECPSHCFSKVDPMRVEVFGNVKTGQTDDSMICMAALHAGLLTDANKAELTIKFNEEEKEYACGPSEESCRVNGVKSSTKDAWNKGFTFEDPKSDCRYFQNKYKGLPITMDFEEFPAGDTKAGWSQKELPDKSNWAVHTSKEAKGTPIGSKLIYYEFECGSNRLKVNIFFMDPPEKERKAHVIFRYIRIEKDDTDMIENYYYLTIDSDTVELRKYYNGSDSSLLPPFKHLFEKHKWQDFHIKQDANTITVWMKSGPEAKETKLLEVNENEIQRGKVGIGSTNLKNTYFNVLATEEIMEEEKPAAMQQDQMFNHLNDTYIKQQCSQNFGMFGKNEVQACQKNILNFCKQECKKIVNEVENVKSYECTMVCFRTYQANKKLQEAADAEEKGEDAAGLKKGLKVDYQPKNNCAGMANTTDWVEAHVTNVLGSGKETSLSVAQEYCGKKSVDKQLPYPDARIAKCAQQLKNRVNCSTLVQVE